MTVGSATLETGTLHSHHRLRRAPKGLTMRWLTLKIKDLLASRSPARPGWRNKRTLRKRPLELELLENRCVPAANATGTISGLAFVDGNGNGAFDAAEAAL